jgi:hypothetical protein
MESPEQIHLRIALRVGPGLVTCIGVLAGEDLISPLEISRFINNPTPNRLLISSDADAEYGEFSATIEVRVSRHAGKTELFVNAPKALPDWKVQLLDSQLIQKSGVPIRSGAAFLGEVSPAHYVLSLQHQGKTVRMLGLAIELITVSDGIDAGLQSLRRGRLCGARAIFQSALSLYPASEELSDLMELSTVLYAAETKVRHDAGEDIDVLRDSSGAESSEDESLTQTIGRLGAASLTDAVAAIRGAFGPNLISQEAHPELPLPVQDALEFLADSIHQKLNLPLEELRREVGNVKKDVKRIVDVTVPGFADGIAKRLGEECWTWLGNDVQVRLIEGESLYRSKAFQCVDSELQFHTPLFAMSSGLEILIRTYLGNIFGEVQDALRRPDVKTHVEGIMKRDTTDTVKEPITLGKVRHLLIAGRIIMQGFRTMFQDETRTILMKLNNPNLTGPIACFAAVLRNHVTHGFKISGMDILLGRKLLLGIDDFHIQEGKAKNYMDHLGHQSLERDKSWECYPGIVYLIWSSLKAED